jgi:hypothetical protein
MAVTYTTAVKNARLTAVEVAIDAGGGVGRLEIGTAAMASILCTIPFNATSGTVSGGVLTFTGFPKSDTNAANSGTAAAARIRTYAATDIVTGLTVGTSATDIVIDNTTIVAGQTITVNSATITHAA